MDSSVARRKTLVRRLLTIHKNGCYLHVTRTIEYIIFDHDPINDSNPNHLTIRGETRRSEDVT